MPATPKEAQQTEIRLALVMNGGVSLAVWMGGVTHELDLLCRASRDSSVGVAANDMPVFEIWKRLAKRTRKKVRVDVVSGASAGGLNGLLLATAIGRGAALPNLREMWRSSATLDELLKPRSPNSVLSGQSLEQKIGEALAAIKEEAGPSSETVTLFVTATALDGRCRTFKDGFEGHFDVRDHRRMYRFKNQPSSEDQPGAWKYVEENGRWKFRQDVRQDFTTDNGPALLQAARATAAFPMAFGPVSEIPLLDYRVQPKPMYGDPASCVMDGGVLNNAPFGPVLDEITKRRIDKRPVERVLVYVVPSAGRLTDEEVKDQRCHKISAGTVGLSALNCPQEVDFRAGTEDLHRRLQTSVRGTREELFERLVLDTGANLEAQMRDAASNLLGEYRRSRARAVVLDVLTERTNTETVTALVAPPEADMRAIHDILDLNLSWLPWQDPQELHNPNLDSWHWGLITAERLLQTLGHYLHDRLRPPHGRRPVLGPRQQEVLVDGTADINYRLRRMLAVTDAVHAELKRQSPPGKGMGERKAANLIEQAFNDLNVPKAVGQLVDEAATHFLQTLEQAELGTRWRRSADVASACLTVEVLTQAFAPPAKVVDRLTPKFTFLRLGPDEMGPLFQEDWSANLRDKKLYGIRFRHFGAFISNDWRQSDFAWGRLDAAHHLLPLLLTHDDGVQEERKLHEAILEAEELPGEPGLSQVERMRTRLEELARCGDDAQLLDGKKAAALKKTGDTAIHNLMAKGWLVRLMAVRLWHRTFHIWHKEQGRVSPTKASKRALEDLAKVLVLLVLLCVLTGAGLMALVVYA